MLPVHLSMPKVSFNQVERSNEEVHCDRIKYNGAEVYRGARLLTIQYPCFLLADIDGVGWRVSVSKLNARCCVRNAGLRKYWMDQ